MKFIYFYFLKSIIIKYFLFRQFEFIINFEFRFIGFNWI